MPGESAALVTARGLGFGLVCLAACGGSEPSGAVHDVIVTPGESVIGLSDGVQLSAEARDEDGGVVDGVHFAWSSSDTAVAQVSSSGFVLGRSAGLATVAARVGGVEGNARVEVEGPVASVEIWEARSDEPGVRLSLIPLGATEGLRAIVRDRQGRRLEGMAVTWSSSNPASLTVDHSGLVSAVGDGSANISAAVEGVESSAVPISVMIMPPLTQLATGDAHTCAIATGGNAYCWGEFPIAIGETPSAGDAPVRLRGTQTWAEVSVGAGHACGLTTAGAAYCWGANPVGQLGDGTTDWHAEPTPVAGGHVFRAVSAGAGWNCAVTTAGEAYCWGGGSDIGGTLVPTLVDGGIAFATISVSTVPQSPKITCGVSVAGEGFCWGNNDYGQLGTGDSAWSGSPRAVVGGHQWKEIAAGPHHACGVTTSGTALCWGNNDLGTFGNGTHLSDPRPTPVSGGPYATISVGRVHTCALRTSGELVCFGSNDGFQLGLEGPTSTPQPVTPAPDLTFGTIRAGTLHTCGLTVDLVVYCWGGPGNGADAGAETGGFVSTPRKVVGQR